MKPPPFTHNRPICDGDKGSTQRPSKDKSAIWQAIEMLEDERLKTIAETSPSAAWASAAAIEIKRREDAANVKPAVIELGDSAPFKKETAKLTGRRRAKKKHRAVWTKKWSSVR